MSVGAVAITCAATITFIASFRWRRARHVELLKLARREALVPTIDLVAVVLSAGGSISEAVGVVADRGPGPVRQTFDAVRLAQERGLLLADALSAMIDELGAEFHPLIAALVVGDQRGAPAGVLLQRLADEADLARRRATEAKLRRLPVALIIPLVVCQLPAVVIGAVVPLAVVAIDNVRG